MALNEIAKHTLELGDKYPYDIHREQKDWAHRAARGIIADLEDRRGIKREFAMVSDISVREDIVDMMAEIIRIAHMEDK